MRSGRGDRVVADRVAVGAGPAVEVPSTMRSPRGVSQDARAVGDDVVEAALRGVDREAHLRDLVGVLHEAQLADSSRGRAARRPSMRRASAESWRRSSAPSVDAVGDGAVGVAQHEVSASAESATASKSAMPPVSSAEVAGDLRERGARADPELADRGVGVELVRVAAGALAEVEGGVVAVARGLEHEHGARLGVGAPAGQVGERRVRAERVVGVVRAQLRRAGRHDEPLARVQPRHLEPPRSRERGLLPGRRDGIRALRPVLGDVFLERVRHRSGGAVGVAVFSLRFGHSPLSPETARALAERS